MNLEMKSIKHFASGSEETYCYTAVVYLDGRPFADVSNDGHGGSDRVHPHDKTTYTKVKGAWNKKFQQIEEYFKSLPNLDVGVHDWMPEGLSQSFELWCGQQVEDMLHKRDMKRTFKKWKVVRRKCDKEGKVYMFNHPHDHKSTAITYRWPDAVILNDLSEAEALDHWKRPVGGDV
tara:strand:+ start:1389 stop:1916 length:528 start_codon:yes stop_codon:yes gene_type:complete